MRVLVTGAGGQVGTDLVRTAPPGSATVPLSKDALDISDPASVKRAFDAHRPEVVVNCAAFTAVDACETQKDHAMHINGEAPGILAAAARSRGARFIHLSTDYVFDGLAAAPYREDHPVAPQSEYGRTKAEGERRVLAEYPGAAIVRTAWVYGPGIANFPRKILARARTQETLRVVDDQRGSPTWSRELARALWLLAERPDAGGIFHWTASGDCTWHGFAVALVEGYRKRGGALAARRIEKVSSSEFAAPAKRPGYSVLSLDRWNRMFPGSAPTSWLAQMNDYLDELVKEPL